MGFTKDYVGSQSPSGKEGDARGAMLLLRPRSMARPSEPAHPSTAHFRAPFKVP
jgi:hypothetical protein